MGFERRELLLITGIIFFLIGLIGVGLQPIYAIIISITVYMGIRVIVGRRKKMIAKSVGEGLCVKCGEKVINNKCPKCDGQKTEN